jgi:hypothetical protein
MDRLFVIFLALVSTTQACDPCICNEWAGILSCYGQNVELFPNVTNKELISHIDILNTSLTYLPDLQAFPNLFTVDIRDNKLLSCDEVNKLKECNSELVLTTDCDDKNECLTVCVNILKNHMLY